MKIKRIVYLRKLNLLIETLNCNRYRDKDYGTVCVVYQLYSRNKVDTNDIVDIPSHIIKYFNTLYKDCKFKITAIQSNENKKK